MLVAVKSCEAHWDRVSAIRDTWAGDDPRVHFFTGWELNVPDTYEALPQKTHAICKWALQRKIAPVFLCDTDTYVCLPRLEPASSYTGYKLPDKEYASGGAGYWLNMEEMTLVAAGDPAKFTNEDEMVGALVGSPIHDPRYALYDDVLPSNDIITRHLSSRKAFEVGMMYKAHRRFLDCGD